MVSVLALDFWQALAAPPAQLGYGGGGGGGGGLGQCSRSFASSALLMPKTIKEISLAFGKVF